MEQLKDPKIRKLSRLMAKIGVFRDRNKAKLGRTIKYRLAILQEYLENGTSKFFISSKNLKKKYLKGFCASPGVVTGKCKIVISKKDIKKLSKSDILVAIGTDFDLLEGIYKSKGVITEEGGLLSHAAVVCRELQKPCLIGVKGATQILKNKKVKLDASKGIVQII